MCILHLTKVSTYMSTFACFYTRMYACIFFVCVFVGHYLFYLDNVFIQICVSSSSFRIWHTVEILFFQILIRISVSRT